MVISVLVAFNVIENCISIGNDELQVQHDMIHCSDALRHRLPAVIIL